MCVHGVCACAHCGGVPQVFALVLDGLDDEEAGAELEAVEADEAAGAAREARAQYREEVVQRLLKKLCRLPLLKGNVLKCCVYLFFI
jgi:hypothetical protein